jgi:hypothetical protein
MNEQERIRRASSDGFFDLTQGVNFDVAIARATSRYWIGKDSGAYLRVRYLMARMLYEW